VCCRGDDAIEPYSELVQAGQAGDPTVWRERCAALGIGGLPLVETRPPAVAEPEQPAEPDVPPAAHA
jgi:hypothetical protein